MTTRTIVKRKADDFKAGMSYLEMQEFVYEVRDALGGGRVAGFSRCGAR